MKKNMEGLPEELQALIHDFRPVHPCAKMVADFMARISYNDEKGIGFCMADYKAEPDFFDARHDGKRGCAESWYRFGAEWDDPRLHGGRL